MPYEENQVYAKYLSSGCEESSSSGCSNCSGSTSECSECCPPGLVAVRDENGKHAGCLTPADAQEFNTNAVKKCPTGYVPLYKEPAALPGEAQFRGCISEEEFAAAYAALNPPA